LENALTMADLSPAVCQPIRARFSVAVLLCIPMIMLTVNFCIRVHFLRRHKSANVKNLAIRAGVGHDPPILRCPLDKHTLISYKIRCAFVTSQIICLEEPTKARLADGVWRRRVRGDALADPGLPKRQHRLSIDQRWERWSCPHMKSIRAKEKVNLESPTIVEGD
jgi:hypothetical protein